MRGGVRWQLSRPSRRMSSGSDTSATRRQAHVTTSSLFLPSRTMPSQEGTVKGHKVMISEGHCVPNFITSSTHPPTHNPHLHAPLNPPTHTPQHHTHPSTPTHTPQPTCIPPTTTHNPCTPPPAHTHITHLHPSTCTHTHNPLAPLHLHTHT